ncbi:hypothetical protein SMRA8_1486 [Stenotrophomonas maltophilia RA8]|uniref:hypothetical protein n=1 Tax=Stenotrophomonas TaxID=40323 RepID=UPI0002C522DA|nr:MULTISPECIES: hypothetical protein [Stenotrophomonas]CCP15511.1 hypothetical protein SMRA8_1486 [Stenotrophomonas maltophilia RA8]VUL89111.1 hypothetical protein PGKDCPLP_01716 [Stenotrophomonas maltophilia]
MARTVDERISALRARRRGEDRASLMAQDSVAVAKYVEKIGQKEAWETKATSKPNTRYVLGAMQEVDADYTRISTETALRVAKQVENRIAGFGLEFHLQGSVPLNVHIRGVSDVDLLTLISAQFLSYDPGGLRATSGAYYPTALTSLQQLKDLRAEEEPALEDAFPAATVDKQGSKAIKISGGSLARSVDVVPSHWYDSADYQRSGALHDRGVIILDKKNNVTMTNYPFKHIREVSDRDLVAMGSLKKAIRLIKNIKADADQDIALPSFDLAAIMFHADMDALRNGHWYELAILAETQRHLDDLYHRPDYSKLLLVPDGTRVIFDSPAKWSALLTLSCEVDRLLEAVANENSIGLPANNHGDRRQLIKSVSL